MSKEQANFTDKYIYGILWLLWVATFLLGAVLITYNFLTQNRYLKIDAILIDFDRQAGPLTIGGILPEKNDEESFAERSINDCLGGNAATHESDIILPTQLIPLNIGKLEYNNGKPRLELNNCIDYDGANDKLLNSVAYPKISSGGKRILKSTIPFETLSGEGLTFIYPFRENQYMKIQLEAVGGKKFKLRIIPNPNHLRYVFRDDDDGQPEQAAARINLVYGRELSHKSIPDCERFDVILFHYNAPAPQSKIISVNKESASVDNQPLTRDYLLDGSIYLDYSPRAGIGILITFLLVGLAFLASFFIPWYRIIEGWKSYYRFTKEGVKGSTYIFLFIPVLALAVFYNVGCILLSHYYFHFERNDYFFKNFTSFDYTNTGVVLLLVFLFPFFGESNFFRHRVMRFIENWGDLIFWGFLVIGSILVYLSVNNQRVWIFPSHVVVRVFIIVFYFLVGIALIGWDKFKMGITLAVLCLLCFVTKDFGFAFLSIITFLVLVLFNYRLKKETGWKVGFILMPVLFMTVFFVAPMFFSGGDYRSERFQLVYTDYTDLTSKNSIGIENANKETTDKQKIILHEAFTSNFRGYWWNLRIPPEFKTVIWSDYVLLYAFLYFGGFWASLLVIFPLLVLIIYLFKIGKIFYHDLPAQTEYSPHRDVLSKVTGFVLFSYATQMLYMLLAMFRVVPLTGQSIPFLSLSRVENFCIMFFVILIYFIILSPKSPPPITQGAPPVNLLNTKKGFEGLKTHFLNTLTGQKFWLGCLSIVVLCVLGWLCNTVPNYAPNSRYIHRNSEKEAIFNHVLRELSRRDAENTTGKIDLNNVINNVETKNLVGFFDKATDEVTNRWRLRKFIDSYWSGRSFHNARLLQTELAKFYYGRESKLSPAEDTFVYEDTKPTVNREKFLARLTYKQRQRFERKLNEPKIKVVRNGNDFYINFNSAAGAVVPNTLEKVRTGNPPAGGEPEILLDENSAMYTKRIDGDERLQFCNADLYGTLPAVSITDAERLKNKSLTIDERLQALSYSAINSYCRSNRIMGGGIVVLDKEGNIKALASYPSLSPNALPNDRESFIAEHRRGAKQLHLFDGAPSVPLTAYPPASTWKMILAGAAVLVDSSTCNNELAQNLIPSNNDYFENLMTRMVSDQNASRFRERLENDFDVYLRGNQNPSNLFDASVIARMEDLKNNTKKPGEEKGTREKVAIGHGDCNVSLIALVQSLARIVTGRKVKPNIFTEIGAEKRELERIEGSEVFSCYKDILNRTSLGGTADVLREADYGGLKIFPREKRMYAKTGTYGEQDKGIQQTYIVFGTENYFFGVILNEKPSPAKHAKNLAKDFLPYVRAYCPEYLE